LEQGERILELLFLVREWQAEHGDLGMGPVGSIVDLSFLSRKQLHRVPTDVITEAEILALYAEGVVEYDEVGDFVCVRNYPLPGTLLLRDTGVHLCAHSTGFVLGESGYIQTFNANTGDELSHRAPYGETNGVAVRGNELYVSRLGKQQIEVYDMVFNHLDTIVSTKLVAPGAMAVGKDESLFICDTLSIKICKRLLITATLVLPYTPFAIATMGDRIYVLDDSPTTGVVVYNTLGERLESIGDDVLEGAVGLAVNSHHRVFVHTGTSIYEFRWGGQMIQQILKFEGLMAMAIDFDFPLLVLHRDQKARSGYAVKYLT
jgi:hypothetical protein